MPVTLACVSALAPLRPEPVEDFAERLTRRFFRMCENPRHRRRMLAMLRNGATDEDDKKRTYERLNRVVMLPVAKSLGVRTTALRAELVLSQLLGVATARYMLKVEPVASLSTDELVSLVAPAIRAVLQPTDERSPRRGGIAPD